MLEGEGKEALWTEIGALWAHEDGQGFNLTLKALPLTGRLVIASGRPRTPPRKERGNEPPPVLITQEQREQLARNGQLADRNPNLDPVRW